MKSNLIIIGSFLAGIFCGMFGNEDVVGYCADAPMWLLYALIIQVGLNIGANGEIGAMLQDMKVSVFLLCAGHTHAKIRKKKSERRGGREWLNLKS